MSNKLLAISALVLTLSACDEHEYKGATGDSAGLVTIGFEDEVEIGATLSASLSDANGHSGSAVTYAWLADDAYISGATASSYTLTTNELGSEIRVRVAYTDNDGYFSQIRSEATDAVLSDVDTLGEITVAGTATVGETLSAFISDSDGYLTSTPVYTWTGAGVATGNKYVIDAADIGNAVSVSVAYKDDRGFTATITGDSDVVIAGGYVDPNAITDDFESYADGVQIATNSAYTVSNVDGTLTLAEISDVEAKDGFSLYLEDSAGTDNGNTKPVVSRAFTDGAADSGSVSVSVFIPTAGYVKSTYIYLGTSEGGSSSSRYTELVFGSKIKFRDQDGNQKDLASYDKDTWIDVTISWDASHAITINIDGTDYTSYDDGGTAVPLEAENDTGAPTLMALYVGDNGSSGTYSYFDDLDSDLFDVPLPETITDDFEGYADGVQIATNLAYTVSNVDGTLTLAEISDDQAKDSFSLYLEDSAGTDNGNTKPVVSRAFTNGAADSGSVSISVYIPTDGYVKSTYVYLGTSEGGSSSSRYTELVFGSKIKFRDQDGNQKDLASYDKDTWIDVIISWDASHAITINIDGTDYTSYDDGGTAVPLVAENDTGAPTLVALYVGDNGSSGTYSYFDDLDSDLFDVAAAPTITDDFEGYADGVQIATNSAYTASNVDGTLTLAEISDDEAKDSFSLYLEDSAGTDNGNTKPVVSREFSGGAADSGSVSISVFIPTAGYVKSTYIYLGTSEGGSSSSRYTELVFGSKIKFRDQDGNQKDLASYDKDTWIDVTISWDASHAITINIDGTDYTTYDDGGTAVPLVAENDTGAPTLMALYVGDNGSSGTYSYFDNLDSTLF
ncbi:MAG: hypothetical protein ACSHW0_01850 [Thalassotalea sp.]